MNIYKSSISQIALVLALCTLGVGTAYADENLKKTAEKEDIVVVTGNSRTELKEILSPGVVSVVFPDDVKGEHKSLPDLLDGIPGVYVRRVGGTGGYTTASIRGSAPSQVNIYIDGVPYNTSSEVAADISTIPISNIDRVEVYRGTVPARFSGAPLGGAINIVTKAPKGVSGNISVGARSFNGWQFSGNLNMPFWGGGLLLGFDADHSDGDFKYPFIAQQELNAIEFGDAAYTPDGIASSPSTIYSMMNGRVRVAESLYPEKRTRKNAESSRANFLVKWKNDDWVAKYTYTYLNRYMPHWVDQTYSKIDLPEATYPYATWQSSVYNPRLHQTQNQHEIALGWNKTLKYWDFAVNLNLSDQDKTYKNHNYTTASGIGKQWANYHTVRYGLGADASYILSNKIVSHLFEIHGGIVNETMNYDANNLINPATGAFQGGDMYRKYSRTISNVQIQDTMTIHPLGDLQIAPILRAEKLTGPVLGTRNNPFGPSSGNYGWQNTEGLSIKKKVGEGWLLFANSGTYNRYPNFYEIYGDGINIRAGTDSIGKAQPLLREYGRNTDIGFGWNGTLFSDFTSSFRTTFFERKTHNTITLYMTPVGGQYINSGTTLSKGVELEANIKYKKFADLQIAATKQDGHYVSGTYYYFGGTSALQRVPEGTKLMTLQSPDLSANARLDLHWFDGALVTYAEVKHTGKKYTQQVSNRQIYETPLTTFDLGAHLKMQNQIKLSFGVNDIFNEGPKQRIKDSGTVSNYYYTCTDPEDFFCYFDPANYISETFTYDSNVGYPQQGRTLYITIAKQFGADDWNALKITPKYKDIDDWNGFYIGGSIGRSEVKNQENEMLVFDQNRDGVYGERVYVAQGLYQNIFLPGFSGKGAAIGNSSSDGVKKDKSDNNSYAIKIGYDRQFGNGILGAVFEYSDHDLSDSISAWSDTKPLTPPFTTAPGVLANYVFTRNIDNIYAFRGRTGLVSERFMGYLTGGVAYGNVDHIFTTTNKVNSFTVINSNNALWGYQYGLGAEYRINGNISIGIEWLRTNLDDSEYHVRVSRNNTTPTNDAFVNCYSFNCTGGTSGQTDMKRTEKNIQNDAFRLTTSYKF